MRIGISSHLTVPQFVPYLNKESKEKAQEIKGISAPSVDTLVKGLLAAGHEVVVFTLDSNVKKTTILQGEKLKIYVSKIRKTAKLRAITFFSFEIKQLTAAIKQEELDVLHAHWSYEYSLAALRTKNKIFVTVRDVAPVIFEFYHDFYRLMRLLMNNRVISKRKKITFIANSKYIQSELQKFYNLPSVIIPNPISDDFIRNLSFLPAKKYNNRIISISNAWGKLKNIDVLLFAFRKLKAEMKDAELFLVGSPFIPEFSKVLALKQCEPNLFDGVILCGKVDRHGLAKLIDQSAILVHPSLTESFGNILLEAMARQIPCIGGKDSGAVPWVLDGGKAGLLCDMTSVDNLTDAMKKLLSNKILWTKYSQAGYNHLLKNFTLDKVIKDTLSLYHLPTTKEIDH